jgi:integration host factor subunit alpha
MISPLKPTAELEVCNMSLTKADLVAVIKEKHGLSRNDAINVVEGTFEIMNATLERGENIKLSGFGNFVVRTKRPRKGRNPQTREEFIIAGRKVVTFKPSPIMKKSVDTV